MVQWKMLLRLGTDDEGDHGGVLDRALRRGRRDPRPRLDDEMGRPHAE